MRPPGSLDQLKQLSYQQLEQLYTSAAGPQQVPRGLFRGHHLAWNQATAGRGRLFKPIIFLGFKLLPYGIDFRQRRWFFLNSGLTVGRFAARVGPSRWRDTEAVCLEYHGSRVPGLIRRQLYDEVKPLSDNLCLGFGGLNAPTGEGDIFFFGLERMEG